MDELAIAVPRRDVTMTEPQAYEHAASILEVGAIDRPSLAMLAKRALDIGVALVGLLLLVPLFALIALSIRLTTGGPAFFRQRRVGRDGQPFGMLKFRTMVCDAHRLRETLAHLNETDGVFKIREDPRVTRIGRLLRRASLDELPQLVNVLRGQMSLVGPRPLIDEEDALVTGVHRERLSVRPGMTGPWQALGPVRPPLREMVVIDCLYAESWSLLGDLKILLETVRHVVRLRGV